MVKAYFKATQTKISQKLGLISHSDLGLLINDSVIDNGNLYHWTCFNYLDFHVYV